MADVLVADELAESGEVSLGPEFVRSGWNAVDFDLATDAGVVTDATGRVVGYVQAAHEEPGVVESWGVVHPEHRGRGIGSSLIDWVAERAASMLAQHPSGRFRHAINAGDQDAAGILDARGMRPVRHFWHMQIDLDDPDETGPAPDDIEIDGVEPPDDLVAVHAVLDRAFAEDWGYHPEPFERWAAEHARDPNYDPSLWLLAKDDGVPVGTLTAVPGMDRGWVGEVGVLPSHRGRGIAAALLRRSIDAFAHRGYRRVLLNVDTENPTGATALYQRAGMRVVKRWDLWERSLAEEPPSDVV